MSVTDTSSCRGGDGHEPVCSYCGGDWNQQFAAALAAEREKARTPFLALADELEADGDDYLFDAAERIRRAASR